jgi:DNA-binding IscR family transcriptional regulator
MLRLTKKADYGLMALKYLAEQTDGSAQSAKDIAEAYHIPQQLLAKILQTLAKAGLLVSHAGTSTCTNKEPLRKVNDSIKELLSGIHIADLVEASDGSPSRGVTVGGGLVTIAL